MKHNCLDLPHWTPRGLQNPWGLTPRPSWAPNGGQTSYESAFGQRLPRLHAPTLSSARAADEEPHPQTAVGQLRGRHRLPPLLRAPDLLRLHGSPDASSGQQGGRRQPVAGRPPFLGRRIRRGHGLPRSTRIFHEHLGNGTVTFCDCSQMPRRCYPLL